MATLGELSHTLLLPVTDTSHIAESRRLVASLIQYGDLTEHDKGRIALILTELATNILKHAGHGHLLVQAVSSARDFTASDGMIEESADVIGVDILSIDKGPGMRDTQACMEDGYSTAGSSGTGLGAIMRQSDAFQIFSTIDKGSVIHARVISSNSKRDIHRPVAISIAGINVPFKGEEVSGDGWGCKATATGISIILADGIGHGQDAHDASRQAVRTFLDVDLGGPAEYIGDVHGALSATRGAAVSIAEWDLYKDNVVFCGIGNVAGSISDRDRGRKLMTYNGTLGHNVGKYHDLNYPITGHGVLVLHSDGLTANWSLDLYPGLADQSAVVIAAVLYRDLSRQRDDACVVVAKRVE